MGFNRDQSAFQVEVCSNRGMEVGFPSVFCCLSTIRRRAAQAETRCNGLRPFRLSWLHREVLQSMAMMSGTRRAIPRSKLGSRP